MVYTNNNLVDKKNNKQRNANVNAVGDAEVSSGLPVYPFAVDVASLPERKYLAGVHFFARFIFLMMAVAIGLSAIIVFRSYARHINPQFIYWDKVENKFEYAKKFNKTRPDENVEKLTQAQYLNEFFIQNYIQKRFGISDSMDENQNNWCDCHKKNGADKKDGENSNQKQIAEMGYFNLNAQCYVCKFSDKGVYSTFSNNEYPAYTKLAEDGETRRVMVLGMEMIGRPATSGGGEVPLSTKIMDYIFSAGRRNSFKSTQYLYKVDFVVEIIRDERIVEKDVMIGYVEIKEFDISPQIKKVIRADYMFNPNYDIILNNYAKEIKKFNANSARK